jgi:hypothetical protein
MGNTGGMLMQRYPASTTQDNAGEFFLLKLYNELARHIAYGYPQISIKAIQSTNLDYWGREYHPLNAISILGKKYFYVLRNPMPFIINWELFSSSDLHTTRIRVMQIEASIGANILQPKTPEPIDEVKDLLNEMVEEVVSQSSDLLYQQVKEFAANTSSEDFFKGLYDAAHSTEDEIAGLGKYLKRLLQNATTSAEIPMPMYPARYIKNIYNSKRLREPIDDLLPISFFQARKLADRALPTVNITCHMLEYLTLCSVIMKENTGWVAHTSETLERKLQIPFLQFKMDILSTLEGSSLELVDQTVDFADLDQPPELTVSINDLKTPQDEADYLIALKLRYCPEQLNNSERAKALSRLHYYAYLQKDINLMILDLTEPYRGTNLWVTPNDFVTGLIEKYSAPPVKRNFPMTLIGNYLRSKTSRINHLLAAHVANMHRRTGLIAKVTLNRQFVSGKMLSNTGSARSLFQRDLQNFIQTIHNSPDPYLMLQNKNKQELRVVMNNFKTIKNDNMFAPGNDFEQQAYNWVATAWYSIIFLMNHKRTINFQAIVSEFPYVELSVRQCKHHMNDDVVKDCCIFAARSKNGFVYKPENGFAAYFNFKHVLAYVNKTKWLFDTAIRFEEHAVIESAALEIGIKKVKLEYENNLSQFISKDTKIHLLTDWSMVLKFSQNENTILEMHKDIEEMDTIDDAAILDAPSQTQVITLAERGGPYVYFCYYSYKVIDGARTPHLPKNEVEETDYERCDRFNRSALGNRNCFAHKMVMNGNNDEIKQLEEVVSIINPFPPYHQLSDVLYSNGAKATYPKAGRVVFEIEVEIDENLEESDLTHFFQDYVSIAGYMDGHPNLNNYLCFGLNVKLNSIKYVHECITPYNCKIRYDCSVLTPKADESVFLNPDASINQSNKIGHNSIFYFKITNADTVDEIMSKIESHFGQINTDLTNIVRRWVTIPNIPNGPVISVALEEFFFTIPYLFGSCKQMIDPIKKGSFMFHIDLILSLIEKNVNKLHKSPYYNQHANLIFKVSLEDIKFNAERAEFIEPLKRKLTNECKSNLAAFDRTQTLLNEQMREQLKKFRHMYVNDTAAQVVTGVKRSKYSADVEPKPKRLRITTEEFDETDVESSSINEAATLSEVESDAEQAAQSGDDELEELY